MASPLRLDMSLQQLAMTQLAINCWERREIKNEINEFFLTNSYHDIFFEVEARLRYWISDVLDEFVYSREKIPPQPLRHQLSCMIISVGRRLIRWLNHKARTNMLKYYLDTVYWTPHGTIDEVKIFEALYTNQPITNVPYVYQEACRLCLEDHVKDLWQKLSNEQKDRIFVKMDPEMWGGDGDLSDFNIYLLIYWQVSDKKSHLFSQTSLPSNFRRVYDFNQSPQVNNFRLSAISGYETAAKYFFDQLTDTEKQQNSFTMARIIINRKLGDSTEISLDSYNHIKNVDILIFLMQQMSSSQREKLMSLHRKDIFQSLLFIWPWQSLFVLMVNQISNQLRQDNYEDLLQMIINRIIFDGEYINDMKSFPMYQMLLEVWALVPVDMKKEFVNRNFTMLFDGFLNKGGDVLFLNHVLNDPDMASKKEDLLERVKDYFYELLTDEKFETVDRILNEVFLYTEEQCANYKNTFDSSEIFEYFIFRDRYDALNELLNWQFQSSEEMDKFISNAKLNTCSSILCGIWNRNSHFGSSSVSTEFFEFFEYNDNDKKNLREQLVNSDDFKSTLKDIAQKGDGEKFDGFLNCCGFSEEESARLRGQFPFQSVAQ